MTKTLNKIDLSMTTGDFPTGTFTPTLYGTTTAGTPTYTSQQGRWQRVGNTVRCSIYMVVTALGGATGQIAIGGLPFTPNSATAARGGAQINYITGINISASSATGVNGLNYTDGVRLFRFIPTTGNLSTLQDTHVTGTLTIWAETTYEVA